MEEVIDKTLDNADGNQDGQELDVNGQPIVKDEPPVIDWENEANPYRKRYGDSQGQIQPLVRTLSQFAEYDHNTKQWKPKAQAPVIPQGSNFDEVLKGYDPEFVKALDGYTKKQITDAIAEFKKESVFMTECNSQVTEARNKSLTEFGSEFEFAKDGKFNTESPLYKLANEILTAKYAQFNPDGTFHKYTSPEAEYMATVEAYAIMAKRAKQAPPDKGKLNAIQGKGSKAAGVKRVLAYEEYNKLTNEQKDAYDLSQAG
ncbi:MAG: hypothetical protein AAB946_00270 [Patescibacteria group bacterium]